MLIDYKKKNIKKGISKNLDNPFIMGNKMKVNVERNIVREKTEKDPNGRGARDFKRRFAKINETQ
jgi:hypothetical protein